MDNKIAAVTMRNITSASAWWLPTTTSGSICDQGEILALLGENGSGKTTLMNMLSGIYFPDEGEIRSSTEGGFEINSPKDAFDLGIGMIHQHFKLVDVFTAAENVALGIDGEKKLDRSADR